MVDEKNSVIIDCLDQLLDFGVSRERAINILSKHPQRGWDLLALMAEGLPYSIAEYFSKNNLFNHAFNLDYNKDVFIVSGEEDLSFKSVYSLVLMHSIIQGNYKDLGFDPDAFYLTLDFTLDVLSGFEDMISLYSEKVESTEGNAK